MFNARRQMPQKHTLDLRREAYLIQQELAALLACFLLLRLLNGIHPHHAEVGFLRDRWDILFPD